MRKAYNSLNHLWRSNLLFVYLNPPDGVFDAHRIKATTNSLEGGINSQLKLLARTHRGRRGEHQRRMLEWWLYLKTELPDDPVEIARQSKWGQDQLAKVQTLPHNENGPDPRKVDTSGVSYAAWVSVADMSASKSSGARRLHQECRLRVL